LYGNHSPAVPFWQTHRDGDWAVHMLDVGQGLAMVIERNGKAILYDTGLAWPGGDSAQQLITPGCVGIICNRKALFSAMSISIIAVGLIRFSSTGHRFGLKARWAGLVISPVFAVKAGNGKGLPSRRTGHSRRANEGKQSLVRGQSR
jgi:hypothetical protein